MLRFNNVMLKKKSSGIYLGLTNTSDSDGTVQLKGSNSDSCKGIFQYTFDLDNWEDANILSTGSTYNTITVPSGETIYIRNFEDEDTVLNRTGSYYGGDSSYYYYYFILTGTYTLSGNIMSLLYKNGTTNDFPDSSKTIYNYFYGFKYLFKDCIQLTGNIPEGFLPSKTMPYRYGYSYMFYGCEGLTGSIPENLLPATTLAIYCYMCMFYGCKKLTSIPEGLLPATNIYQNCYTSMFNGCTGLTSLPEKFTIPATTLAACCYQSMFANCTGLKSIPEGILPTKTINFSQCYDGMFKNCTGLTSIPEGLLPATTLGSYCYMGMFSGCSGLTSIPEGLLHATTLAYQCYQEMFKDCTGLKSIPEKLLPATTLAEHCYDSMFSGCTGLTSIPEELLPVTFLANYCYEYMFSKCTGITSIPEGLLPATTLTGYCYQAMFSGCKGLTSIPEGLLPATTLTGLCCYHGMFSGCTGLTSIPEGLLPATILSNGRANEGYNYGCYSRMFSGCTGLTSIPEGLLPATTLNTWCYSYMFYGCTKLTSIPEDLLPATNINGYYCYEYMFSGCSGLTNTCKLLATTLTSCCYRSMFANCTSLTNIPELPATTLVYNCYNGMFSECSFTYSTTKDETNKYIWRMPSSGTGTYSSTSDYATGKMNQLNTTYYLSIQPLYNYFNIKAITADSTVQLNKNGEPADITLEYSTNKLTWNTYTFGNVITLTNVDDKVYFRNSSETTTYFSTSTSNYYQFVITGNVSLNSNIMSLVHKYGMESNIPNTYCFYNLFKDCTAISNIDNLSIPTTLADYCFSNMFYNCTSLTNVCNLPATTLADYCYQSMFDNCIGLTSLPEDLLPATTLTEGCYAGMFNNCTKLTSLSEKLLPATILAQNCYSAMFNNCTKLTTLPKLTITSTAKSCCENMFYGCSSLDISNCNLINFKGTTIEYMAFYRMYYDCSAIKLSETQTTECKYAYRIPSMGYTCSSTGTDALTGMFASTGGTFTGTPSANTTYFTNVYVPEPFNITVENNDTTITISKNGSPTDITLQYSTDYSEWTDVTFGTSITVNTGEKLYIRNTSETTTNFSTSSSNYYKITGSNNFNANGDISYLLNKNGGVTTIPCSYCFCSLFNNSTYLKSISNIDLSFTTLKTWCYYNMFKNCTGLTGSLPKLPATTLTTYCYYYMFYGCTGLTSIPEDLLPATTLAEQCYYYMFYGCSKLTNIPELPATTLTRWCYYAMFQNCSKIKLSTTQTSEYTKEFRIPTSGTGTTTTSSLIDMFTSTGGTFTGTPSINTTYYLAE